jgi:folate-dependent phosphoribosylglycinamide formyltransferase PurN
VSPDAPLRVALVSNGNAFSTMMLRPLFDEPRVAVVGAVLVRQPPGEGGRLRRLVRLARRTGWRYARHKSGSIAVPALIGAIDRTPVFLDQLCERRGVAHRTLDSINGKDGLATLRAWEPDVLVSVSSPERFDPEVLRIASVASINLHWALLPRYAGIAPYFWVLRNGERETGLTIHLMVPELDAGDVLRQRTLAIAPVDTSLGLQLRLTELGAEELAAAIRGLPDSLATATPQDRDGRSYFSWMRPADVAALRRNGRSLARWSDYTRMRAMLTGR